jgi:hypothetical protein
VHCISRHDRLIVADPGPSSRRVARFPSAVGALDISYPLEQSLELRPLSSFHVCRTSGGPGEPGG